MAMVDVDVSSLQVDSSHHHEGRQMLGAVQHSSDVPDELSR